MLHAGLRRGRSSHPSRTALSGAPGAGPQAGAQPGFAKYTSSAAPRRSRDVQLITKRRTP